MELSLMDFKGAEALAREIGEEGAIMDLLSTRMAELSFYSEEDAENLAYRIAEIAVTAKNFYTQVLPRLIPLSTEEETLEFLTEVRMNFQYLRDCIEEFEEKSVTLMRDREEDAEGDEED